MFISPLISYLRILICLLLIYNANLIQSCVMIFAAKEEVTENCLKNTVYLSIDFFGTVEKRICTCQKDRLSNLLYGHTYSSYQFRSYF